jgi:hypothetical protein
VFRSFFHPYISSTFHIFFISPLSLFSGEKVQKLNEFLATSFQLVQMKQILVLRDLSLEKFVSRSGETAASSSSSQTQDEVPHENEGSDFEAMVEIDREFG